VSEELNDLAGFRIGDVGSPLSNTRHVVPVGVGAIDLGYQNISTAAVTVRSSQTIKLEAHRSSKTRTYSDDNLIIFDFHEI
jgi:hypothetical protein